MLFPATSLLTNKILHRETLIFVDRSICRQGTPEDDEDRQMMGKAILKPEDPSFNSRAEDIEARGRKWKKAQRRWNHFVKSAIGGVVETNNFEFFFFFFCIYTKVKNCMEMVRGALVTAKQKLEDIVSFPGCW